MAATPRPVPRESGTRTLDRQNPQNVARSNSRPGTGASHFHDPDLPRHGALKRRMIAARPSDEETPRISPLDLRSPSPRAMGTAPTVAGLRASNHHHRVRTVLNLWRAANLLRKQRGSWGS